MVFSQKLVNRYKELKEDVRDCLLLMQVGAFKQVTDEDARAVSQVTGPSTPLSSG
jgi:DNA mismatch repair ATPase MutS